LYKMKQSLIYLLLLSNVTRVSCYVSGSNFLLPWQYLYYVMKNQTKQLVGSGSIRDGKHTRIRNLHYGSSANKQEDVLEFNIMKLKSKT